MVSGEIAVILKSINLTFSLILELLTTDPAQRAYLEDYIRYVEEAHIRVVHCSENYTSSCGRDISQTARAITRYSDEFDFAEQYEELRKLFGRLSSEVKRLEDTL